ncbi:MAG TPA: preprotein translocase subunit SecG [Verrucomicrobiae bacterium]|nr:preprotein translocase subunit SecG [Verrucomicrobiae bacterium]
MSILIGILTAVHVLVAIFLIVLVLMQKSSEQGIGAAFGGGMTETVFGAGTTTALVRLTIWCACLLLATTLTLAILHSHRGQRSGSLMERTLSTTPVAPMPGQPGPPMNTEPSSVPAPTTPATPATPSTTPPQNQAAPQPAAPAGKTP